MMNSIPIIFLLLLMGQSYPSSSQPPSDPEKSRVNFASVVAHLDPGGDLMVAAHTDGLVESFAEGLRSLPALLPPGNIDEDVLRVFDRLPAFINSSGLYAIDGFGMSLLPGSDGMNTLKMFLRRDPAAGNLPLWRSMVGGAPRSFASLDYLPAETAMARICGGEPDQFFKLIADAVRQVGGAKTSKAFDQALATAAATLGTSVETLFASLAADAFFAVQLSASQTLPIPLPAADGADQAAPLTLPLPGLLIGTAVRDNTLPVMIKHLMDRNAISCVTTQITGITLVSVTVPEITGSYPLQPAFALHKGMFLLGTTPEVVLSAISAAEKKNGLSTTPAFKKMLAGLPLKNNGLSFVDRRFTETLANVQIALMHSSGGRVRPGIMSGAENFTGSHLLVVVNEPEGISVSGTTSASAFQTLQGATVVPLSVAMGAAVAIPSFMHARSAAVRNSCISNLRMLDGAKEQWAMETNKDEGAEVVEPEVLKYLPGARMPVCPQGGRYTLGPIGQPPTCSHPGHQLPQ